MQVTVAYKALTAKGKRRLLRAAVALLSAEKIPATQADVHPILTGGNVDARLKSEVVARVISGLFRGQFSLDVSTAEVFGGSDAS